MQSIGIGSKTSTGGVVIEGNDGIMFNGVVASSIGHKATCPSCKKGIGEIIAVGNRQINLPAGPAARAGDYIACGCPTGSNVLLGEAAVIIGSDNASSYASFSTQTNTIQPYPIVDSGQCKITKIYWSYGEDNEIINSISKYYVDLNLHLETEGYLANEKVKVDINGEQLFVAIGNDGSGFVKNALRLSNIELGDE